MRVACSPRPARVGPLAGGGAERVAGGREAASWPCFPHPGRAFGVPGTPPWRTPQAVFSARRGSGFILGPQSDSRRNSRSRRSKRRWNLGSEGGGPVRDLQPCTCHSAFLGLAVKGAVELDGSADSAAHTGVHRIARAPCQIADSGLVGLGGARGLLSSSFWEAWMLPAQNRTRVGLLCVSSEPSSRELCGRRACNHLAFQKDRRLQETCLPCYSLFSFFVIVVDNPVRDQLCIAVST